MKQGGARFGFESSLWVRCDECNKKGTSMACQTSDSGDDPGERRCWLRLGGGSGDAGEGWEVESTGLEGGYRRWRSQR